MFRAGHARRKAWTANEGKSLIFFSFQAALGVELQDLFKLHRDISTILDGESSTQCPKLMVAADY